MDTRIAQAEQLMSLIHGQTKEAYRILRVLKHLTGELGSLIKDLQENKEDDD